MLNSATIGMFAYGTYSIAWAINDLLRGAQLEILAELALIGFGLLLGLGAGLVRARVGTLRAPS